jgi:hypothetical protein
VCIELWVIFLAAELLLTNRTLENVGDPSGARAALGSAWHCTNRARRSHLLPVWRWCDPNRPLRGQFDREARHKGLVCNRRTFNAINAKTAMRITRPVVRMKKDVAS